MASVIFICVIIMTIYVFKGYKKIKIMCSDVAIITDYVLATTGLQERGIYDPTLLPEPEKVRTSELENEQN